MYKSVPFNDGDKVRILEKKEKNDKGEKKFSKEIYTIDKKEGYRLLVNGNQQEKEEKKKGKVISSLVSNAKITPAEAKAAVVQKDESKQKRTIKKRDIRFIERT